jgi:CheY-like chemotaxis protein/nitrogen-specific signal transduction histidine kinase
MKKKVLIIEDDQPLAEMTASMLLKEGMATKTAYSGKDCLELLKKEQFDLILMDYKLQDMDGLQLIEEINNNELYSINKYTPVVVLTAYLPADTIKKQLLEKGVQIFLHKPFGRSELMDIIENIFLTNEIMSQRQILTEKLGNLDYKQPDPYFYLPHGVFYFDDQLICKKWNHAAFQKFPELVEASKEKPLTILLENKTGNFASKLREFIQDPNMDVLSFLDTLQCQKTQFFVQFTFQRLPEEIGENLHVLIISILEDLAKKKGLNLESLTAIEYLPVGILEIHQQHSTFHAGFINDRFWHFLGENAVDKKVIEGIILERFKDSVQFVMSTGKIQFRKSEKILESNSRKFDMLILPSESNQGKVFFMIWPSGTEVTDKSDLSQFSPKKIDFPIGFIRQFSHDIRTPLNSVLGFSKLLMKSDEVIKIPSLFGDLKTIYENGEKLHLMIDELVDYSRIQSDEIKLLPMILDVNNLMENVISQLSFRFPNVRLETLFEELPPIQSDEELLKKVFYHILMNAILFGKIDKENEILVKTALAGENSIVISIRDRGVGIPEKDLENVFAPFWRGQYAIERKIKGFGLGLFISSHFLNLLNSQIKIESKINEGTQVQIFIPLF